MQDVALTSPDVQASLMMYSVILAELSGTSCAETLMLHALKEVHII